MIAKIILLAVAVISFVASTVVTQYFADNDWLVAAFICGFASLICMFGSAAMFTAIAKVVFS